MSNRILPVLSTTYGRYDNASRSALLTMLGNTSRVIKFRTECGDE